MIIKLRGGKIMAYHTFIRIGIVLLLLTGLCLGALDQSGIIAEKNQTLSEFSAQVPQDVMSSNVADLEAPTSAASNAGNDVAVYTKQAPATERVGKLYPSQILSNPPQYMYYGGKYIPWNDFVSTSPSSHPGLWIERAVSWSMYATLPWGGWTQELIYVPAASPVSMYEIHPNGFVSTYNLGYNQPGYYTLWYYADEPGRHTCMISTNSGYSNQVIIDVYGFVGTVITQKVNPNHSEDPQKQCESNPQCTWSNGLCYCRGDDDPSKEFESIPTCPSGCYWGGSQCVCTGDSPNSGGGSDDPSKEFESIPTCPSGCYWSGSQCVCTGDSPNSGGGSDDSSSSGNLGASS
jgi:hypothetical protein